MKPLLVLVVLAGLTYGVMQWKRQEDERKAAVAAEAAKAAEAKAAEQQARAATPKPFVSTSSLNPADRVKGAREATSRSGLNSGGVEDKAKMGQKH